MAAAAAPLLLAAGMGAAPYIGSAVGELGGKGIRKFGKMLGFKKGGTLNQKGMSKALNKATVKRTGVRTVKKNELVIPAGLAKQIKKVAKRKGHVTKHHVRRKKK